MSSPLEDLQSAYLFHYFKAEEARRDFVRLYGREPENPYCDPDFKVTVQFVSPKGEAMPHP